MDDKYGYESTKDIFKQNDTDFKARLNKNFNEEYIETGKYHGYNVDEAARGDYEEIAKKYCVSFPGETEVKQKEVSSEHKSKLFKRAMIILATAATLGSSVLFVDFANHPEDYLTTHPDFDGRATISEILDRTPENFGIGGR